MPNFAVVLDFIPVAFCCGICLEIALEVTQIVLDLSQQSGKLYVQAGAGIVADSEPVSEWEETQNKAKAIVLAVELVKNSLSLDPTD